MVFFGVLEVGRDGRGGFGAVDELAFCYLLWRVEVRSQGGSFV